MRKILFIHSEFREQVELLSDEEAGRLLKAVFSYCADGVCPELSPVAQVTFISIRQSIERAHQKYSQTVEKNRENGKKGGRPLKVDNQREENPNNPPVIPVSEKEPNEKLASSKKPPEGLGFDAKPYVNVSVNEIVSENVSERECVAAEAATHGAVAPSAPPPSGDAPTSKVNSKISLKSGKTTFVPPTVEMVSTFCRENGLNLVNPERFCDFYASKGWLVGKNLMRDWQATVRNWQRTEQTQPRASPVSNNAPPNSTSAPALTYENALAKSTIARISDPDLLRLPVIDVICSNVGGDENG